MAHITIRGRVVSAGAAAVLSAILAVAPSAQASKYYGCVKKNGGALRVVSRTTKCKRGERKIFFDSEGQPGKPGLNGANGTNGASGAGSFESTLPHNVTEEGTWALAIQTANSVAFSTISFNIPLAAAPAVSFINEGRPGTAACPGTAAAPAATSGNLCVYMARAETITIEIFDPSFQFGEVNHASPWGTAVKAFTNAFAPGLAYGTWAVTG
jgi:hypothetical protein